MEIYYIKFMVARRLFFPVCLGPRHHLLPARLFFDVHPGRLGLFQKYAAKVPVCLPKMRFPGRPWAYIKFVGEKFLPFAKYVGLCQKKARGSSNEPPLALRFYYNI